MDGEGGETTYSYDANGNVESVTNALGMVTRTTYDGEDQPLMVTDAYGTELARSCEILSRDNNGNPLQVKDFNSNITLSEYNVLNLVSKITDAKGKFASSSYTPTGNPEKIIDRRGNSTTIEYDQLGRESKITDALNQSLSTTYDKVGNVKTVIDHRGTITEYFYDQYYRVTKVEKGGYVLSQNDYDNNGNITASWDANYNHRRMDYDELNRLASTTFSDGYSVVYGYDPVRNILTSTDEQGKVTTNTYDNEGRLLTTSFAGETTSQEYDALGNVIAVIYPLGNKQVMSYDLLGRLSSVSDDPDTSNLVTRYEYDANDNLRFQYDPRGNKVEYVYDQLNRTTQHIQHKQTGNLIVFYDYDAEGNLVSLVDAKAQQYSYEYDPLNRQKKANYPETTTPYLTINSIVTEYDKNSNVARITELKTSHSGAIINDVTSNEYDIFDRVSFTTQRGLPIIYTYDLNGNRTGVTSPSGSTSYTFDSRNRLASAVAENKTTTFAYTPDGKQAAIAYPNGTEVRYSYNPANRIERVTNSSGNTNLSSYDYLYDANGNRTQQAEIQNNITETTAYTYNSLGQMTGYTVTGDSTSSEVQYTFEGYNRKTETVSENGTPSKKQTYHYDETDWLTSIEDDTDPENIQLISYT